MKKLIIINGTMGAGKSAVCRELNKTLDNSVWLDGDWCWMMNPLVVNEENRKMVEDNIIFLLRSFLANSSFEYVVFDWVMDYENMFERILQGLQGFDFNLYKMTLTCSEDCLRARIRGDVELNLRSGDAIEKSVEKLQRYDDMDTKKIDTTEMSVEEVVTEVRKVLSELGR